MGYVPPPGLQAAIARLHTYAPHRGGSASSEGLAGMGGSTGRALSGYMSKQPGAKPTGAPQQPTHDPEMYKRYVQGTGMNRGLEQTDAGPSATDNSIGYAKQVANQSMLDQADQNVTNNGLAEDARLGGKFTPDGLVKADKLAQANGHDRLMLRGMIGLGGTMAAQPPGQMPPQQIQSQPQQLPQQPPPMAPSAPGRF